jgi:hypothetical protein
VGLEANAKNQAIYLRDNVIAKYAANFDIDQVISAPPMQCEVFTAICNSKSHH